MSGLILLVLLIIKRSKITSEAQEEFLKQYNTFFEEFKAEATSSWLYYILFAFRRLITNILVIFVKINIIQLSVTLTLSLSVFTT